MVAYQNQVPWHAAQEALDAGSGHHQGAVEGQLGPQPSHLVQEGSRPALGRSKDMASKRGVRVMCGSARRGTRGGGSQAHASACPSPEKHSKLSWPSNTYSSWPWQEKVDAAQAAERKHAQAGNFGRKRSGLS